MIAARLNSADDHLELQVGIALKQLCFKIRRRRVIGKIHSAPFDIEDSIGRSACDRSEDTAVSTGEVRAAGQTEIGPHILPHREDGEVIRSDIGRRRQTTCHVAAGLVSNHKVESPVGTNVHSAVGLVI